MAVLAFDKEAERGDVEPQARRGRDLELHPGHRDRAQDVTVRKSEHRSLGCGGQFQEFARAAINVGG